MKIGYFLLLFLCGIPACISHSSPSYYSDQEALQAFKRSLSHGSKNTLFNWSPNHNLCNWTGIACSSRHQRVVSLNLTGMSLTGLISPFLGNLSFLRVLVLRDNNFYGQIPPEFGRLFRLRLLGMSRNKLEGLIPSTLGDCRSLQYLILAYNNLTGSVPSRLGLLSRIDTLALGGNPLTGTIPPFLGNFSFLTMLHLGETKIHGGIPIELGKLTQLEELYLNSNFLTGSIPTALFHCYLIEHLSLATNQLTGTIPALIGNLSSLSFLDLGENSLHGIIPLSLGMLTQLEILSLDSNYLTGPILPALTNNTHLQSLSMTNNNLSERIPWNFGKLSELQYLYLAETYLFGEIPSSLFNCTRLRVLSLANNTLGSTVPLEIGKLFYLQRLNLWGNHLVSRDLSILTAFTNCSYLEWINFSDNYLTGILPSSIGRLSNMLYLLVLDTNKIEGNIPSEIGNLTNLGVLDVSSNHLKGRIPSTLGLISSLQRLSLHKNNLYGRIPTSFDGITRLFLLQLSENMLLGTIPDSFGNLSQLRRLHLDHNQLSGKMPASLGKCQNLEVVDLSYNRLRGKVPPELSGLQNLQFFFNISNNLLDGSLLEMSKWVMVQAIDLSLNYFSGEIPAALSSCTALQYLNLSCNSFNGSIPVSLTNLKNLEDIDLFRNNLSGTIPPALTKMKMLQHINLSSNRLTGEVPKGGVFLKLKKSAVMENPGLCGTWINLPPCSPSKHGLHSLSKRVMIPTVVGVAIFIMSILLLVYSYRRHTSRNTLPLNVGPQRTSYEELAEATSGFSQTNLLGVGSFGSVYKGILNNGTNIAVKVLNLRDENALQSFSRECNILKRVRHRNVIKTISVCSNLDFKSLVLPFMSNGSLERWLHPEEANERRLILRDLLRIAMEIAQGLTYLHHHCFVQVIHCDLKPSNVLLGDDMTAYIADFGISKLLFGNSMDSLNFTNALKGSVGYIAPEYGVGGNLSTKGDVYSYGILLLEMFTRKRPIDDMFVDGNNLQKWVGMNFSNKITEVVDNNLLEDVNETDMSMVLGCLTQLLQVGMVCTMELPQQRPDMIEIIERLEKITGAFLGTPRTFQLPINIQPLIENTSIIKKMNSQSYSSSTS